MIDVTTQPYHDIDGRSSEECIRIWGGEAGELLLALAVWDDMTLQNTGSPLRYTSIQKAVHSWIKYQNAGNKRKYFYLSTDTDAMAFVESKLAAHNRDSEEAEDDDDGSVALDITMPPEAQQDEILKHLMTVNGTGCPHLKMILANVDKYKLRKELVELFLTSIYRTMWNMNEPLRKRIKLYIYHAKAIGIGRDNSGHPTHLPREAAWVDIVSDDVCFEERKVAAFPAFSEDVSILINYPQAIGELHKEAAQFIKGMTGGSDATTEILPKIVKKYELWDQLTKELLDSTQGLVRYEVKVGTSSGGERERESGSGEKVGEKVGVDPMMYKIGEKLDGQ